MTANEKKKKKMRQNTKHGTVEGSGSHNNLYAEYIMRNAGLKEAQAGIKMAGRNIKRLKYADDTTVMAESEGTKKPLDESEREELKSWLKAQHSENEDHGIWSHHFMGNRWGNSVRLHIFWLQNHCRW